MEHPNLNEYYLAEDGSGLIHRPSDGGPPVFIPWTEAILKDLAQSINAELDRELIDELRKSNSF